MPQHPEARRVYLAGPPYAEEYRRRAEALMRARGWEPVDPMRRDYRGRTEGYETEIVEGECLCSCGWLKSLSFTTRSGLQTRFAVSDAVRRFADALSDGGHSVHTPDLYDGRTFATIEEGMAYSEEIGGPMAIVDRARAAVESLPSEVVYVGFSLGVMPAQSLAQTRSGARGAVLCYAALPLGQWGENWPATWPEGVRLQLHILGGDEDFEIAQGLAATVPEAELFVYPGTEHYFAEYDEEAARVLTQRVLSSLG